MTSPSDARDWKRIRVIGMLGTTQTLGWASSFYLIAFLANPIARDHGISASHHFAAFSAALLISALVGPRVGRTIDRLGGREVLVVSNLVFATGLMLLAFSYAVATLWLAWFIIGIAMGLGLYEAAFAALGRMYGTSARSAITGITLFAGFASTIGWPLTAWGEVELGWRMTCACWAIAHLLLGLPLNFLLPRLEVKAVAEPTAVDGRVVMDRSMFLLGFAFAAGWVVATAMAAHLPLLLEAAGSSTEQAIAASALLGLSQVAARLAEASLNRFHPLSSARLSMLLHPIGAGLLLVGGGLLATPFVMLHGAGTGILTVARGTVPITVFGPAIYGYRLGILGAPARILQVGAPVSFGLLLDVYGAQAVLFSTGLCLLSAIALLAVVEGRRTMVVPAKVDCKQS